MNLTATLVEGAGININPYQGLKLRRSYAQTLMSPAGINLNPYQGLKHPRHSLQNRQQSRNQPKSLSGIETTDARRQRPIFRKAGINLNPYQGLKRGGVLYRSYSKQN